MTQQEAKVMHVLLKRVFDKELAGHFPYELLAEADRLIHPVRCAECGGYRVQCAMMVNLNTQEIGEDFGSWDETDTKWCLDCEKHVLLVNPCTEEDEPNKGYDRWMNNEVQFARLLSEIVAAGFLALDPPMVADMCDSMDLSPEEAELLLNRAEGVWAEAKAEADAEAAQRKKD